MDVEDDKVQASLTYESFPLFHASHSGWLVGIFKSQPTVPNPRFIIYLFIYFFSCEVESIFNFWVCIFLGTFMFKISWSLFFLLIS